LIKVSWSSENVLDTCINSQTCQKEMAERQKLADELTQLVNNTKPPKTIRVKADHMAKMQAVVEAARELVDYNILGDKKSGKKLFKLEQALNELGGGGE
jgi:predicted carbohydrate-binding protein with CBM5 and CBM33 domain